MKKFLIYLILFLVLFFSVLYIILNQISQKTGKTISYFPDLLKQVISSPSELSSPYFLILGLDKRDDWLEKTETTDTILLASLKQNQIKLLSLPRDLWDWELDQKINQIYPQSLTQNDSYGYISQNFSRLTGIPIKQVIIFNTQNLIDLVKLIGGVDVYQEIGFIDNDYPNPEYINHPDSNYPVYITVKYPSGWIHLDESNISPFIRSRKSSDSPNGGGTDLGRIKRQQLVFEAIFKKIVSLDYLKNTDILFSLYDLWTNRIQSNISDLNLALILKSQLKNLSDTTINKIDIPTGENPKTDILYHPVTFINKQWVFLPQDKGYTTLQNFIRSSL